MPAANTMRHRPKSVSRRQKIARMRRQCSVCSCTQMAPVKDAHKKNKVSPQLGTRRRKKTEELNAGKMPMWERFHPFKTCLSFPPTVMFVLCFFLLFDVTLRIWLLVMYTL